jgi:hypothetical protein
MTPLLPESDSTSPADMSQRTLSRRALIRLGWVVPVVLAVGVPRDAFAQ